MKKRLKKDKVKCQYCGDAPVNHAFSYLGGIISAFLDPFFNRISKWVPEWVVKGAECFLKVLLYILVFLRIVRFSDDIEKATTLRSKVIWEEAKKRGIKMQQIVVFGKPTDNYRAKVNSKYIYFDSLPLPSLPFGSDEKWDDKFFLKERFLKEGIPVPEYERIPFFKAKREKLFEKLSKPLIVKPQTGSRGRHTTTTIYSMKDFEKAFRLARKICPQVVCEEHLSGYVCRATCVDGKLAGFYRAEPASVVGDGVKSIQELILEQNEKRENRVEEIKISNELIEYLARAGLKKEDILPSGKRIWLSHRTGRLFGGKTCEMLDKLHNDFTSLLEQAARVTGLSVVGFDCIIPDPEASPSSQKWGIIEGNTLPFIDLHYFALSGEPRNIAGMIWDLWKEK